MPSSYRSLSSPLSGDEVDVVSEGGVVFGHLFGSHVSDWGLRFGRIGVRERAKANQEAYQNRQRSCP